MAVLNDSYRGGSPSLPGRSGDLQRVQFKRGVICEGFAPGPERQAWLRWLKAGPRAAVFVEREPQTPPCSIQVVAEHNQRRELQLVLVWAAPVASQCLDVAVRCLYLYPRTKRLI